MSSKIYKLKKWLSLEDTAKRLSLELNENISVADVLQLAIDQHLRISVSFPYDWYGKICDITEDEEKATTFKDVIGLEGEMVRLYEYQKCSEYEYIKVLPKLYEFKAGIYELKLIGNEKLDLEFELRNALNMPAVDVINLNGFYVKSKNGIVIERQTTLYPDEYYELQKELRSDFKKTISQNILDVEKEKIINEIDSRPFLKESFNYPCAGIREIEGANFVIQTKHLDEFLASLDDEPENLNLDNALYLLGEVINAVKSKNKKWTQSTIIDEILTQRQGEQRSGLEQRKIEEYFSTANKLFKAK